MLKTGSVAGGLGAKLAELGKSSLLGIGSKGALAIGSVVSFTAAIAGARSALDQFGDIADKSAAGGVDPEFFQGVAYQAKLAGVEIDGVAGALATFAKNSGLAAEGKGRMASAFQALDPELLKSIQRAGTQQERFLAVADAIARSTTAAKAAAIATAAFGDQGTKLVAVLRGGATEVERLNAAAKDMGLIVDRSLIERADELGDRLDTAAQIVQTKLNVGLVSLAPLMSDAAGWAAEFAKLMAIAYEQTKAIEDRQFINPLQNQLAETYTQIDAVKGDIASLKQQLAGQGGQGMKLELDIGEAEQKLAGLTALANQLLNRIQEIQGFKPPAPAGPPVDPREALFANMAGRGGDGRMKPVKPFYTPGGDKPTSNDAAAAAIKQAEAVEELIGNLAAERDMIGQSAVEQRVATELRKAGVSATAEQQAQIVALVQTIEGENAALDRLKDAYATAEGYAKSFASSLVSDLSKGTSVAESLSNAFAGLGEQLLQMAADQAISALFSNLLGSAIGGGFSPFGGSAITPRTGLPPLFDQGGYTGFGGKYEPAGIVHRGEYVFDAASTRRIGVPNLERIRGFANGGFTGGPSGSNPLPINDNEPAIVISPSYHIDAKGSTMTPAQIKALLEANNKRLRQELPSMLADARRRGGI
jgi:hypothetical protein